MRHIPIEISKFYVSALYHFNLELDHSAHYSSAFEFKTRFLINTIFLLGTHALPHVGSGKKNEVAVLVLSFVSQMVMPKVFQCDLEAVKRLIAGLEADPTSVTSQELGKYFDSKF